MALIKTNIDEAIARVEDWKGKEISYEPIVGGITNPNFKVTVDGTNYFLKIPGAGTDYIDRDNCHVANQIASDAGVGAKVCYYYSDTGVEIFEWLEGYRQVTFGDVYDQKMFEGMITAIEKYNNSGMEMPLVQSVFDQTWEMIDRAKQGDYLPPWHDRAEFIVKKTEEAFDTYGRILKPCHNDYWTNNMMADENDVIKIVDFEYASMNDPSYDLAIVSTSNYFTEAMDEYMIKVYTGGEFDDMLFARTKLMEITGDIKWSYWALQQYMFSDVDFDYMEWYGVNCSRPMAKWQDPRFDTWLNKLNGKPIFKTRRK
ncbi:MAG: phosphotransferase [Lachnospiraceae bacterium]|nr:phosphotransferase [Lachnospiraceae bacterium]